jgi:hypothetical protein
MDAFHVHSPQRFDPGPAIACAPWERRPGTCTIRAKDGMGLPDLVGHNGCVALVNACLLPKKQQLTLERAAALPIRQAPETRNGEGNT